MANYRNRQLLDLAYLLPCQHCGAPAPSEPAHSNWSRHGKGMSIKAHDNYFAALCRKCHMELDQGKNMTFEERNDFWQAAYEKTQLEIWQRKLVKVVVWM